MSVNEQVNSPKGLFLETFPEKPTSNQFIIETYYLHN